MKTDNFEDTFPNISLVRSEILRLKQLNLSDIGYEELKITINDIFFNIPAVPATINEGSRLYRARKFSFHGFPFSKISEISIPPTENTKYFGRAHKPFHPLFYCSSNIKLALNEVCRSNSLDPNTHNVCWAVVGEWQVKKGVTISLSNLCYSEDVIEARGDLGNSRQISLEVLNSKPKSNPPLKDNTKLVTTELLEFFSDEFAKDNIQSPDDYKISVAYTDLIFKNSRGFFEGVNYPSVASKYEGDNVVLTPLCLDEKLEFNRAFVVTAGFTMDNPKLNFTILAENKDQEGDEIIWGDDIVIR